MGKIHISNDLKNKLDKVFSLKNDDNSKDIPLDNPVITPEIKFKECKTTEQKIKRFFDLNYIEYVKFVFITSFVGGIGLTFGMKMGKIIFY